MNATRDSECLQRIAQQDDAALAELYDRYIHLLYPVAMKIVGSAAEAEDIMQEVWLQVWHKASTYDPKRGVVPAWLLTITRSRALDLLRSRKARQHREAESSKAHTGELPALMAKVDDPSQVTETNQARQSLQQALLAIEPQQRQVLQLAYWEGLSQTEIAERLGSPLGTVKSWARQGLRELRKALPPGVWW